MINLHMDTTTWPEGNTVIYGRTYDTTGESLCLPLGNWVSNRNVEYMFAPYYRFTSFAMGGAINHMDYLQRLTDEQLLALLIAGEADNQTLAGQVAVACTVTERLRRQRPHYGLTLREVMLKPWQYSTFNDNHWQRFTPRIDSHLKMAQFAIAGFVLSPVEGATHYHTHDLRPRPTWTQPQYSTLLGRIGVHVFYSEK